MEHARITVYCYDDAGFYVGTDVAVESPLERGCGIYLIPDKATDVAPPDAIDGKVLRWTGQGWEHVDPPGPTAEQVRSMRNAMLTASDWTQLPDVQHVVNRFEWACYRQQLREIPDQPGFPRSVLWPTPPVKKC